MKLHQRSKKVRRRGSTARSCINTHIQSNGADEVSKMLLISTDLAVTLYIQMIGRLLFAVRALFDALERLHHIYRDILAHANQAV